MKHISNIRHIIKIKTHNQTTQKTSTTTTTGTTTSSSSQLSSSFPDTPRRRWPLPCTAEPRLVARPAPRKVGALMELFIDFSDGTFHSICSMDFEKEDHQTSFERLFVSSGVRFGKFSKGLDHGRLGDIHSQNAPLETRLHFLNTQMCLTKGVLLWSFQGALFDCLPFAISRGLYKLIYITYCIGFPNSWLSW